MERFSIQNVKDTDVNRVLRQVQDALNKLADAHSAQVPVAKATTDKINALRSEINTKVAASASLQASLSANTWTRIAFPGTYTSVPNYHIICRASADYNRELYYELRNLTETDFEIRVPEAATMQLDTTGVSGVYVGEALP